MTANAAQMRHGNPLMVDYTPSSAVPAGQVEEVGEYPLVAHNAIDANDLGALAAGGGVYLCTVDADLSPGDKVYWDSSAEKITATADAGNNKHFGFLPPDSNPAADGDTCLVVHQPDGTSI